VAPAGSVGGGVDDELDQDFGVHASVGQGFGGPGAPAGAGQRRLPLLVTPGSCSGCSRPPIRGGPCERSNTRASRSSGSICTGGGRCWCG
jgi:hypothetical protein